MIGYTAALLACFPGIVLYRCIAPLLACLPPERAHDLVLRLLHGAGQLYLDRLLPAPVADPVRLLGLVFPNRVGLAAGLDKNADCIDMLGGLGFGFVEVGTVTPQPQPGNPSPRLFRLPGARALINRMGFNNRGLAHVTRRVEQRRWRGVLGINIGKNKAVPVERALEDYLVGLEAVHHLADYVVINLSSPNTPNLRDLQRGMALTSLFEGLAEARKRLEDMQGRRVPMLLKISPDLANEEVKAISEYLVAVGVEGVVVANTTVARSGVATHRHAKEAGGLSGAPLYERALDLVARVRKVAGSSLAIVGVGGIDSPEKAVAMVDAGADLVQIYTGFVYEGPALLTAAVRALRDYGFRDGVRPGASATEPGAGINIRAA